MLELLLAVIALGAAWALAWAMGGRVPPIPSEVEEREMPQPVAHPSYRDTSSHRPVSVRSRAVTARRASGGTGEVAYQRLARRTEEQMDALNLRMEENSDRTVEALNGIITELREIKVDVRRLEQNDGHLTNRISDLEFQVIGTRDEVQRSQSVASPGRIKAARAAITDAVKSPWGRVVAFCVGFVAIVSALSTVPKAVDVVKDAFVYLDKINDPVAVKK